MADLGSGLSVTITSVVSTIALYAGIAALLGFVIMLLVTIGDFLADPRIAAHHIAKS